MPAAAYPSNTARSSANAICRAASFLPVRIPGSALDVVDLLPVDRERDQQLDDRPGAAQAGDDTLRGWVNRVQVSCADRGQLETARIGNVDGRC